MGRLWNDVKGSIGDSNQNVLSQTQVKEIQSILLMILKDIKEICEKNNLTFCLIGGSAIGAIRHRGFIPWDDDIDIAMPRKDYEVFRNIINSQYNEKYSMTDSIRKNNYGKVIPKLRLKGTVYRTILDVDNRDCEMKSDIFIIENTNDNKLLRNIHGFFCMAFGYLLSCRRLYDKKEYFSGIYRSKDFKLKTIIGFIISFASLNQWAFWTEKLYSHCKNDNSNLITLPSDGLHYFGGLIPRKTICKTIFVPFEDTTMPIPAEYDFYLKRIYGDYMQIPPVEKRLLSYYVDIDYGKYSTDIKG